MEDKNNIHEFLRHHMSIENMELKEPDIAFMNNARKKILARKKSSSEIEDFFSLVAAFLNFKIKLYHAVIATLVIGGIILYATKNDKAATNESHTNEYVSNIASVKSSTVLSSIYTFGLNKKQLYGRSTN